MKRSPSQFTNVLFVLSLVAAAVAVPASPLSAAVITNTYTLGTQGSGTTILAGIGGLITWIPKGALPAGSILKSVSVNARLDAAISDSWASEILVYVDPLIGAPGTGALLQVGGVEDTKLGTVVTQLNWANGQGDVGTTVIDTKTAGVNFLDGIDLNTVRLSIGNGYISATWSGTITVTYTPPPAFMGLAWTGADATSPTQWSTSPTVLNWLKDGTSIVAYTQTPAQPVMFDNSVGAGSKIVDISVADVAPASVTFNNNTTGAATYTLTGTKGITGAAGLTKNGNGTLIVKNANTYSGPTSINAGTLQISDGANRLPTGTAVNLANVAGATLDLNGNNQTIVSLAGGGASGGAVTLGSGALTVSNASFGGTISGIGGSLIKNGAGGLTLSGENTYSGGTTVTGGAVILGNKHGFGTGTVTLAGGNTFQTTGFEGNGEYTPGDIHGALPNAFVLSGGKVTVNVAFGGGTSNDIWINTSVSGPGGLVVIGSGREQGLTLSGAKTFEGGVTLGTVGSTQIPNVSIDNVGSLGTGTLRSELKGTDYSATSGGLRITADLSTGVPNDIVLAKGARIVVRLVNDLPTTLAGLISDEAAGVPADAGSLIKAGPGALTFSGNNTYSGRTIINDGTLSVSSLNKVSGGAVSSSLGAPTDAANGTIGIGRTTTAGKLLYTGAGETTDRVIDLAGTTGGVTIDQSGPSGLLKFTSANTATGAGIKTLTLQGSTDGTGEIAGAIVDNSSVNKTSLTKAGTGTWTLSGNNTYSGDTTINAGTLLVNGTHTGGGMYTVADTATLGGAGTIGSAVTVNVGGTLAPGASAATLSVGTVAAPTSVTMVGESIYKWEFDGTAGNKVAILGDLQLDSGWKLALVDAGGKPASGVEYNLFTYTGSFSGTIAADIIASPADWPPPRITQDTGRIYLTFGLKGDANGDGVVDAADYIILKQNFGMTGDAQWSQGDFNDDKAVDWADLQILMAKFGTRSVGGAPAAPEPGSVMLLMFGAAALLRRRQGYGGQVRRRTA